MKEKLQNGPRFEIDFIAGERVKKESILDVRTHFKPTETFQSIHVLLFMSPPRGKERIHKRRGLIKDYSEQTLLRKCSKRT